MNRRQTVLSRARLCSRVATSVFLFTLFRLLLGADPLFAQADQGTITGTVADPSGAVVANAEVTLTNADDNLVLETRSDKSGVYTFSPLKIGNYRISAKAQGFATITQSNLHLDVQQRLAVNIQLKPGSVSESIEVTSAPPLMQTEEASVGQVLSTNTINETPLNGRNWVYIAQLTAGVDPVQGSRGNGKGDFNANGQRAEQNNFILDGVDNNTDVVDFLNGASYVVRPPPDALAEFKVQTSDYSAEFGHSAGAVVNASIKSGTNQVHGDLWEYVRNNDFDARDWEAATVPAYHQNQFGATLGLPIVKNRLFFFGDIEANRIVFQETDTLTVPTALMRHGNFSELLNGTFNGTGAPILLSEPGNPSAPMGSACGSAQNVMCASEINSVAQRLLNLYPTSNMGNGGNFQNPNYLAMRNSADNTFQFDSRVDWNVSAKDQAFARFSLLNEPGDRPAPLGPILDGGNFLAFGDVGNIVNLGQNFALSETHLFTSTLGNEFRFGYTWGHFAFHQENVSNPGFAQSLGLGGVPGGAGNGGLPTVNIGGISGFGSPEFYASNEYENVFQILDNVSKVAGNHALKFGVSFQHIRFATAQPPVARGEYDFFSGAASCPDSISYTGLSPALGGTGAGFGVADYLSDRMGCAQISNIGTTDDVRWDRSVYAQDDWKTTSRLTLNLGLRYEYPQTYRELAGHQAEWHPTGPLMAGNTPSVYLIPTQSQSISLGSVLPGLLSANNIALQYGGNPYLVSQDKVNFAPRIGLAYRLTDHLAIRGGYGLFYGGLESVGYNPNLGVNAPFVFQSSYTAPGGCVPGACLTDGLTLETGFTTAIQAGLINALVTPSLRGVDPTVKTPYSEDYSLALESGITNNLVATLSYVGSQSHHLIVFTNPNAPLALQTNGANQATEQPLAGFGGAIFSSYAGVSNYNALQAKVERRVSRGLSFLATYTYSHALDDAPTPLGSDGDIASYPNTNIQAIHDQYSNSPWDTRQRLTFNGNYQLPFGRGHQYATLLDYFVGGWSSSLTFAAQTGNPFSVVPVGTFPAASGAAFLNATLVGDPFAPGGTPPPSNPGITCPRSVRNRTNWYNPCAFGNPLPGSSITAPVSGAAALAYLGGRRDDVYGPGYERINMSWFKAFRIREGKILQFRTDIFNLFNTPSLANPNGNYNGGGLQSGVNNNSSAGGSITQPRFFQNFTPDARFFQFALKFSF
jgi:hypothetical protein